MKNTKKWLALTLAAGMTCGMLTGCGGGDTSADNTTADNAEDTLQIQVILNTLASEYWGYVAAGANAYGAEHDDVTVEVVGPPSETSYDEQANMIETAIGSGQYDGFVISALQPDTVTNKIAGVEVPIIAVNTPLDAPEILGFVGTGNEAAAAEGGRAAVEAAKAAGWEEIFAIEIAGPQGDTTVNQRLAGFQKGVEEAGGTFLADKIQYADSLADKAVTSMEAIMQNYPDGIAVIVCHNDDMAIAAARTAKSNPAYANTIFCGFDGIQSACEAILAGEETMSVAQDAYGMGYKAVEACVGAIRGETPEAFLDTGCSIVTAENAQERLDTLKSYLD